MKHLAYKKLELREVYEFRILNTIETYHALDEWNLSQLRIKNPYDDMKLFSVFEAVF